MNISLQGKNAIICGSSQGIGLAVAKELSQLGATCFLLARSEERLQQAIKELHTSAAQAHAAFAVDLANRQQTDAVVQSILAQHTIDILINNSGGPAAGPVFTATADQFLHAFSQHLLANHLLTQAVTKGMKEAQWGRIVNIVSTSVKIPLPNLGVSNTIRGAVAPWAKTMANELAQFGITVNNVLPGFTKTGRLDSLVATTAKNSGKEYKAVAEEMMADVPARRFGEAEEVAALAAFLCTPAAAYINGTSIPVDGGRTGSI